MYYAESAQLLQVFNMQIRGRIERGDDGLHHARPLSARRCHVCCMRGTRCVCLYSNHTKKTTQEKRRKGDHRQRACSATNEIDDATELNPSL